MEQNTNLKYEKQYAKAVLNGTKKYEIRKASKGYTSGRKNLVSIGGVLNGPLQRGWQPKKVYSSAHYQLIGANTTFILWNSGTISFRDNSGVKREIDKETYQFAKMNYIIKNIDYVVFEITDVDTETYIEEEK